MTTSRVTRLVVHSTDFVSVDHGDNATSYGTETELHVHNHTSVVPPSYVPTYATERRREVHLSRINAPVAVIAWAPIDVVRFGVYPHDVAPSAPWNDCTSNGLSCTSHPLAGINAPVYVMATANASDTSYGNNTSMLLLFASGTSPVAPPQYFHVDGNALFMAGPNGTRTTPSATATPSFCKSISSYGVNMCAQEAFSSPAAVRVGSPLGQSIDKFVVRIATGGGDDSFWINGSTLRLDVDPGGGRDTIRAENVSGGYVLRGGSDSTQIMLEYPLCAGVVDLTESHSVHRVVIFGNGHAIGVDNWPNGTTFFTGVSPNSNDVIVVANASRDDDVYAEADMPLPPCAQCSTSTPSPPLPPAAASPDRALTTVVVAASVAVPAVKTGPQSWDYNDTSCGDDSTYVPLRIAQLDPSNGTHNVRCVRCIWSDRFR